MPPRKTSRAACNVHCLGTGDGWPCADRNHSSYLYELAGTLLLIDCGESVTRSLTARKFDWNALDGIVLSHTHADHLGGLAMLLQGMWLEGRSRDLTIHLPGHVIKPLRNLLHHGYLFDELFGFQLKFQPLPVGKSFTVGKVRLTPHPTSHLDGFRRAFQKKYRVGFDAYCFVIEGAGKRVVHSADLGAPQDLLPVLTKPVDLLVCELAHFTPADLFATLGGHAIKQAAFIHLARNVRARLTSVKRMAARRLPDIPCRFPNDGDVLKF
ncbi:MBL fold metallo-hydrolase [bacterium]|nr:MBL fold metallo-hydrolase [bacterium]